MSDAEKHSLEDDAKSPVGPAHGGVDDIEPRTGFKAFYYNSYTQVALLGLVCFMCPGLFNALNGLGGGGRVDQTTSANSNAAVYATFAFMAFFAGSVNNKLGPRLTLLLGATGYSLYVGSFLAINIHPNAKAFVIAAGVVLGFCAGLLWTAQGSLMLAYPTEAQKGRFVAIFWSIFNLGAVVGASVALGQNINNKGNSVGNGTYIGFLVLTLIGVVIPLAMADPRKMVRSDGSRVVAPRQPSWKTEFWSLWVALRTDPSIILLFPFFFASNYFYTWQTNDYNAALFDISARSLNSFVYWTSQIFGSIAIGILLDTPQFSRRTRAFAGWLVLFAMVFIVHIWGYEYQKGYTRESTDAVKHPDLIKIAIHDKAYVPRIWLYIFCGLLDSMWQTTAYWLMGAMSNDAAKLAYFTGFYKSIQSAGAAGVWRADGVGLPFMNIFISTWVLMAAGLVFAFPMIYYRVRNHTELQEEVLARMDDQGRIRSVREIEGKE